MTYIGMDMMGPRVEPSMIDIENEGECTWLLSHIKQVEAVVKRLIETEGELFRTKKVQGGEDAVGIDSVTGKQLKALLEAGCGSGCLMLPAVNMNPYVRVYHEASGRYAGVICSGEKTIYEKVNGLNQVVSDIRASLSKNEMRSIEKRHERARAKRHDSASRYMESFRQSYARITCVRIDLGFRKGKFVESEDFLGDLEIVKYYWRQMRQDLTKGVPISGMIGFVVRLEYGVLTGYHLHGLFIFDGSRRQQDILLSQAIGEHWINQVVPNGAGRYYNCNRNKERYRHLGIGVINYYEELKYQALKDLVIDYMVKPDFSLEYIAPRERTMFRGKMPRCSPSNRKGRPRKKLIHGDH